MGDTATNPSLGWFNPASFGAAGASGANAGWFPSVTNDSVTTEILNQSVPTMPAAGGNQGWFNMQSAFGGVDQETGFRTNGWFNPVVNTAIGGLQAYLGFQNLNQAKKNADREWKAWNLNYDNQASLMNEQLASRQAFRNSAGGVASGNVDDFMSKYGAAPRG